MGRSVRRDCSPIWRSVASPARPPPSRVGSGLFQAFLGDEGKVDITLDGLGDKWEAADIFYKPYPANHFTHTGIDAAIALRKGGLAVADVARATLAVAPPTVRTIGDPIEVKRAPETGYQAQFSGPYTVVAGLIGGGGLGVGLADFTDELAIDPYRRALMAKVDVVGDPALLDVYPYQFPCRLTVETSTGETLVAEVLTNRGGTDRPLSTEELAKKFADNVDGLLAGADADQLTTSLGQLATASSVANALAPLANLGQL